MQRIIIYIGLILAIALSACEQDLNIPLPPHTPKLVVNAYLTPTEPAQVYVSRSYATLEKVDAEDLIIKNATVEIWENDTKIQTLAYRDTAFVDSFVWNAPEVYSGTYENTDWYPEAGKTYEVRVSHPEYPATNAEVNIPAVPVLKDFKLRKDAIIIAGFGGWENRWSILDFTVDDPAGTQFYDVQVRVSYRFDNADPNFPDSLQDDLWLQRNFYRDAEGLYGDNNPIQDTAFDGTTGTFSVATLLPDNWYNDPQNPIQNFEILGFDITMMVANDDLGTFLVKHTLQKESRSEGVESAFIPTEPVVVPHNVEGGYGIVGGFADYNVYMKP